MENTTDEQAIQMVLGAMNAQADGANLNVPDFLKREVFKSHNAPFVRIIEEMVQLGYIRLDVRSNNHVITTAGRNAVTA